MAILPGSNLNSTPLAAGTPPRTRLRCSSRSPNFRPPFAIASRSVSQVRCACVRVQVIRSGLGGGKKERPEFVYSRAKPEVRWPHKSDELLQQRIGRESESAGRPRLPDCEELSRSDARLVVVEEREEYVATNRDGETPLARRLEREEMVRKRKAFRQRQKGQVRRLQSMSKLALRKATDLKSRARRLSTAICSMELARPDTDVLDAWPEQLNNDELSVVVRNVGVQNWQWALELYGWLNLQKWYTPNPRLVATILHILSRANQFLCGYGSGAMTRVQKARPLCQTLLQTWRELRNENACASVLEEEDDETLLSATNSIRLSRARSAGDPTRTTAKKRETKGRECDSCDCAEPRDEGSVCKVCGKDSPEPGSSGGSGAKGSESGWHLSSGREDWRRSNTLGSMVRDAGAKQWAHMVCTLWMPGTRCLNMGTMGVFDVSGVTTSRRKALCSICLRKGGACIKCRVPKCSTPFHVWCAHEKSGIVQDGSNKVGFFGNV